MSGFTLLESLIALAVLSLVVAATSQSLITSARTGSLVSDKRMALAVAKAAMETSLSTGSAADTQGLSNGVVWKVTRGTWPSTEAVGLVHITVTAYPADKPEVGVTLESLTEGDAE